MGKNFVSICCMAFIIMFITACSDKKPAVEYKEPPQKESLYKKTYDAKGRLLSEVVSVFAGKITKYVYSYYNTNEVKSKTTYINDVKNHKEELYYKNGVVKTRQFFLDAKLDGIAKDYYNDGKLHKEGRYKNGKKEDIFTSYHKNGKLKYTISFLHDRFYGFSKVYYDNGNKKSITNYNRSEQIIYLKTYTRDGRILKDMRRGSGTVNTYSSSGRLHSQTTYFKGRKTDEKFFE